MKINLLELVKAEMALVGYLAPFVVIAFFILKKWGKKTLDQETAETPDIRLKKTMMTESEYYNRK